MLNKCTTALLLSDVPSFSTMYKTLAESIGVQMKVEAEWKDTYRANQDVIILGSKYLDKVNRAYYPKTVIILKPSENPARYIKEGIGHFIFDYQNQYELLVALFKQETLVIHSSSLELKNLIKSSSITSFCFKDYDFKFDKNQYNYKGKPVYFTDSQKEYLADWLLNGFKDNKKRMVIFTLRKKFGQDFLKDVNRFGQIKGGKDEQ